MSISVGKQTVAVGISAVRFEEDTLHFQLTDGREVSLPLEWYPKLRQATKAQRENWRLIGKGVGIHWPDLDEDLSIGGLLAT